MCRHGKGSALAVGHRVNHLAPAVDAVAPGKVPWVGGAAGGAVHHHQAVLDGNAASVFQQSRQPCLADGGTLMPNLMDAEPGADWDTILASTFLEG